MGVLVIYLYNLDTKCCNFLLAKNRLVNKTLENKSIPSLELQAIDLAVETIIDTYNELSGPSCVQPISIESLFIYSDSVVALSWINSYINLFEKMNGKSTFILNRLQNISMKCQLQPITFSFVSGEQNPADCISRTVSF